MATQSPDTLKEDFTERPVMETQEPTGSPEGVKKEQDTNEDVLTSEPPENNNKEKVAVKQEEQKYPQCTTSTIFVSHLPPQLAEVHLQKLFQAYGKILRIHFLSEKGYAFVEFDSVEAAILAIKRVHDRILLGRSLVVRPAYSREQSQTAKRFQNEQASVDSRIASLKRALDEKKQQREKKQRT